MSIRISGRKIALFLYALSIYIGASYLVWSTYDNQTISIIARLFIHMGTITLAVYEFFKKRLLKFDNRALAAIVMLALFEVFITFLPVEKGIFLDLARIRIVICVSLLFTLDDEDRKTIFTYMTYIFVAITLPSLIYYLLYMAGINVPYDIISSENAGKVYYGAHYQHYPFGLILVHSGFVSRYSGIYDEPGFIGTIAAFLFVAGYRRLDKKWLVLLLIEGVMTLSVAFLIMIAVFFVIDSFIHDAKKLGLILIALLLGVVLLANITSNNPFITAIQSRLDFSSLLLFRNNRTSDLFNQAFSQFLKDGGYPLWFGYGEGAYSLNAQMTGASSYKCLFYDFGIIGVIIYVLVLIMVGRKFRFNKETIPFFCIFVLSIYQRPYIMNIQFLSLLICGMSFCHCFNNIEKRSTDE